MKVKELEGEALDRAVGFAEGCDFAPVAYSTKWEFGEPVVISEPNYHHEAMGCGLEDRNITDRYEAMQHGWDCAISRMLEQIPEGDLYTSDQLAAAILKATKPLEEEVERLKVDRAKKQKESVTIFDANCELRAQLAAAQEENGRLRIALDCTKTDLVRMQELEKERDDFKRDAAEFSSQVSRLVDHNNNLVNHREELILEITRIKRGDFSNERIENDSLKLCINVQNEQIEKLTAERDVLLSALRELIAS